ncbi:YdcF family protein [Verrucomicrobia bacterium]|nr:YdcF family protein [Verrucomicrobiota bacterium]
MSIRYTWNQDIQEAALELWNYHCLRKAPAAAEFILILGSHDLRVGDRAAELYHQGLAPLLLFTGGYGNWTEGIFERPEATLISQRAMELGVPWDRILIEPRASNTGENIRYSKALLHEKQIVVHRGLAVQKPYMERRALASLRKQWPEICWQITSPELDFHAYCDQEITRELVTEIMVGDLQRIMEYPKLGFQMTQELPSSVLCAYEFLIQQGYCGHLMGN